MLASLLAGCGSGTKTVTVNGPPAATSSSQATSGAQTASTSSTSASTSATGGTSTQATGPSEPPTSFAHLAAFQSPSGNIGCMIVGGSARCDIVHRDWSPPARPSSCPPIVDFGQGLLVGRSGKGSIVCAGDTARDPSVPRLPYGSASQVEDFICVSRVSGMTCTDRSDGHGFFISVQRYSLF